jgi:hypothetical protein
MSDTKKFYDEGWNARVRKEAYDRFASRDWRDGWKDCNEADPEDRKEME